MVSRTKRARHILVDVLDMVAGGLIAAAIGQRSWKLGLLAVTLTVLALAADRWSALHD